MFSPCFKQVEVGERRLRFVLLRLILRYAIRYQNDNLMLNNADYDTVLREKCCSFTDGHLSSLGRRRKSLRLNIPLTSKVHLSQKPCMRIDDRPLPSDLSKLAYSAMRGLSNPRPSRLRDVRQGGCPAGTHNAMLLPHRSRRRGQGHR